MGYWELGRDDGDKGGGRKQHPHGGSIPNFTSGLLAAWGCVRRERLQKRGMEKECLLMRWSLYMARSGGGHMSKAGEYWFSIFYW